MAAIKLSRKKLILYRERNILRLPIPSSLLPAATGLSSYLLREVKTVGADLQHWVGSHVQSSGWLVQKFLLSVGIGGTFPMDGVTPGLNF